MKRMVFVALVVVSLFGGGTLFALYGAQSSEELILACVGEDSRLPPELACAYIRQVRAPNPNQATKSQPEQTLFGFTLAGHHQDNRRSATLIQYFMSQGIQWNKAHDSALTPLHIAVLYSHADLVKAFIEAGASLSPIVEAPGRAIHGLNVLDFARMLKAKAQETGKSADLVKHTRIEELLARSGARPGVPSR